MRRVWRVPWRTHIIPYYGLFLCDIQVSDLTVRDLVLEGCRSGSQPSKCIEIYPNSPVDSWNIPTQKQLMCSPQTDQSLTCSCYNNMLPHLAGMINTELWFAKRCIKFIRMCMKSDNNTVKTISMIFVNGLYSVLGANYRVLNMIWI